MRVRRIAVIVLAGLAGLALAVGVTMAATSLTSQRIGLDSEPLTAGDELAPLARATPRPARTTPARKPKRRRRPAPAATTTPARTTPATTTPARAAPPPAATTPAQKDDHHGEPPEPHGPDGDRDEDD